MAAARSCHGPACIPVDRAARLVLLRRRIDAWILETSWANSLAAREQQAIVGAELGDERDPAPTEHFCHHSVTRCQTGR